MNAGVVLWPVAFVAACTAAALVAAWNESRNNARRQREAINDQIDAADEWDAHAAEQSIINAFGRKGES